MLLTGAFAHINAVMIEWSVGKQTDRIDLLKQLKVKNMIAVN